MRIMVFGSEGIGGSSICRNIQKWYEPEVEIIRIDRKLKNDYDGVEDVSEFAKRYGEIDLFVPLNTQKLHDFMFEPEVMDKSVFGTGNLLLTEFTEGKLWDMLDGSGFEYVVPKILSIDEGFINELYPLVSEKEDRACLKKKSSNGGRGFYVVTDNINSFGKDIGVVKSGKERWYYGDIPYPKLNKDDWYFQEYCNGFLLSVDVLYHDGMIQEMLMRKRMEEMDGKTTVAKHEFFEHVYDVCEFLGEMNQLYGVHGFQFKHAQSGDGGWKLIDWNPRLQSGIVFGDVWGNYMLRDVINYFMGEYYIRKDDLKNWCQQKYNICLEKRKGKVPYARRDFSRITTNE